MTVPYINWAICQIKVLSTYHFKILPYNSSTHNVHIRPLSPNFTHYTLKQTIPLITGQIINDLFVTLVFNIDCLFKSNLPINWLLFPWR